jgi:hypothetical protein
MIEDVSYCGLLCSGCPIHWATRETDPKLKNKMRTAIAILTRKLYNMDLCVEDITGCDGCRIENGRLFPACEACPVRTCARERGLANCANCEDYICEELERFFVDNPEAKSRLEFIRSVI